MFRWLKDHFIPHSGNEHRPHFLRHKTTREALILVVGLELILVILPIATRLNLGLKGSPAEVLSAVLTNLTNEERSEVLLPTLKENALLDQAATLKAQDMAAKGYFAHTSPEGLTPWYWFDKVGYKYDYAGENLAIDFSDSVDVTNAWMDSPTHRANIIKASYTEVGTGIAEGEYNGHRTIYIAQLYARPQLVLAPVLPTETSPKSETKTQVLGAEKTGSAKLTEEKPIVASVAEKPEPIQPIEKAETSSKPIENITSKVEMAVSSPRHLFNILLMSLLAIAVLALLLNILIKPEIQHRDLITNGLALMTILLSVYVFNSFMVTKTVITNEAAVIYSDLETSQ